LYRQHIVEFPAASPNLHISYFERTNRKGHKHALNRTCETAIPRSLQLLVRISPKWESAERDFRQNRIVLNDARMALNFKDHPVISTTIADLCVAQNRYAERKLSIEVFKNYA